MLPRSAIFADIMLRINVAKSYETRNFLSVGFALNPQDFERAWPPPEGASKLKELLGTEKWRQQKRVKSIEKG